jgi:hypothetical protein
MCHVARTAQKGKLAGVFELRRNKHEKKENQNNKIEKPNFLTTSNITVFLREVQYFDWRYENHPYTTFKMSLKAPE